MECCKYIYKTLWSDRIGPSAGLVTLNEMEKLKSWKIISNMVKKSKIFEKNG